MESADCRIRNHGGDNQRSFAASIFFPCVEHGRFVVGLHVDRPHRVRPIGSDRLSHFDSQMTVLVRP